MSEPWEVRAELARQGEPCGGFVTECCNPAAHIRYLKLTERQKYLMTLEREYLARRD